MKNVRWSIFGNKLAACAIGKTKPLWRFVC